MVGFDQFARQAVRLGGLTGQSRWRDSSLAPACIFWYQLIVTNSTLTVKRRRGRPTLYEGGEGKGAPQIGLRLPPTELAALDDWIAQQPKPKPSRPVAIRRFLELGLLKANGK